MVEKTRRKARGTNGWVIQNGFKDLGRVVNSNPDYDYKDAVLYELFRNSEYLCSVHINIGVVTILHYPTMSDVRKAGWRLYRANVHKK
jgi:hypothetical protein